MLRRSTEALGNLEALTYWYCFKRKNEISGKVMA